MTDCFTSQVKKQFGARAAAGVQLILKLVARCLVNLVSPTSSEYVLQFETHSRQKNLHTPAKQCNGDPEPHLARVGTVQAISF